MLTAKVIILSAKGAIANLTEALTFDSNCADDYFSRGDVCREQGFYQKAIQNSTHFIELDVGERLLHQAEIKYPGKSVDWYFEKVIWDLERDSLAR